MCSRKSAPPHRLNLPNNLLLRSIAFSRFATAPRRSTLLSVVCHSLSISSPPIYWLVCLFGRSLSLFMLKVPDFCLACGEALITADGISGLMLVIRSRWCVMSFVEPFTIVNHSEQWEWVSPLPELKKITPLPKPPADTNQVRGLIVRCITFSGADSDSLCVVIQMLLSPPPPAGTVLIKSPLLPAEIDPRSPRPDAVPTNGVLIYKLPPPPTPDQPNDSKQRLLQPPPSPSALPGTPISAPAIDPISAATKLAATKFRGCYQSRAIIKPVLKRSTGSGAAGEKKVTRWGDEKIVCSPPPQPAKSIAITTAAIGAAPPATSGNDSGGEVSSDDTSLGSPLSPTIIDARCHHCGAFSIAAEMHSVAKAYSLCRYVIGLTLTRSPAFGLVLICVLVCVVFVSTICSVQCAKSTVSQFRITAVYSIASVVTTLTPPQLPNKLIHSRQLSSSLSFVLSILRLLLLDCVLCGSRCVALFTPLLLLCISNVIAYSSSVSLTPLPSLFILAFAAEPSICQCARVCVFLQIRFVKFVLFLQMKRARSKLRQ